MNKTELILNNMQLANKIAHKEHKKLPPCVQFDEVQSAAYMGLVDAASKSKPDKPFEKYVIYRIYGEIKDYLRSLYWSKTIKVNYLIEDIETKQLFFDDSFEDLIKGLTVIEKEILKMYFQDELTISTIAAKKNLSTTRIHQLIKKSLEVIKGSYKAA